MQQASLDELRVRCTQTARARLERLGLSRDCCLPNDKAFGRLFDCPAADPLGGGDELVEHFRRRDSRSWQFLPGLIEPETTAREFERRCPARAAAIVAAAERAVARGEVDVGPRRVSIGSHPDWTVDPMSGTRAPHIHWSRIPFLDPGTAGDCKLTWELNRHQYFITLGRAYLLTGDDRYASLVLAHMSSWIDDNPPQIGINWTSSLELALRSISWTWALHLVRHSPSLDSRSLRRVLKCLYLQGRHIEHNLSTYFSPNTHITGEALGLLYIGAAFPEFECSLRWRALGARILAEQLDRQLLPDGVYFEHSTYYHRYTTDFYLHALLLSRRTESWLESIIRPKLDRLLDYLLHITRPDGTSPLIGDDDGGRLVVIGERAPNDFRDTLAIGAALLQRSDCAYVAGDAVEELLWLLGPSGMAAYDRLAPMQPSCASRAFPASGYFVMRQSWDQGADWAIVRCGPPAPPVGAHAHADALALELTLAGSPVLIDPGTYLYTASREEREYFRGSAAHNTVTVDERSSAEPGRSVFKWASVPQCRVTAWLSNDTLDFFQGEHDGFLRLEAPLIHSRAVFFLRGEYWVIRDRLRTDGRHRLAVHFHWAPGVTLCATGANGVAARLPGDRSPQVQAAVFASHGGLSSKQDWASPAYGMRSPATTSVFRLDVEGTQEIVSVFARSKASLRLQQCAWRTGTGTDGGELTLVTEAGSDTILTGPMAAREHNEIHSDAAWTWVRRSPTGDVSAFALIGGRNLTIGDTRVFRSDAVVNCATGKLRNSRWQIDVHTPARSPTRAFHSRIDTIDASCAASVE